MKRRPYYPGFHCIIWCYSNGGEINDIGSILLAHYVPEQNRPYMHTAMARMREIL